MTAHKHTQEIEEKLIHLPRKNLFGRALYDLEMLLVGGFAPLTGFLSRGDYESVVRDMRLRDGTLWPIPITLPVEQGTHRVGDELVLCDEYGNPLALFTIEELWQPDRKEEARQVYGTDDPHHPGVAVLLRDENVMYAGGPVTTIALPRRYDFKELRHTPSELREHFKKAGHKRVVAFQTRNPLHRAHFEILKRAAESLDAHVLLHPVVGVTREGDIDYLTRVRAYKRLYDAELKDFTTLSLLPLAMRMAGPREALWHALVRKNYGATHFIVGRDHAGPGKDRNGNDYYEPFAAHDLVREHADEIGIGLFLSPEVVYVEELGAYVGSDEVEKHHTVQKLSGTEVRRMLRSGEELPEWFSFPETLEELRHGISKEQNKGAAIFFTGLSGAGKSTIAQVLYMRLLEEARKDITFLDGDIVRTHLSKGLGFSKEDRIANVLRIGFVAREVVRHGGIALASAIAPHAGARDENRRSIEALGHYVEVYVATPIEECERRDTKGLYKKARAGELKGFTGIDDPYDAPENADIVVDTLSCSPEEAAEQILKYLKQKKIV